MSYTIIAENKQLTGSDQFNFFEVFGLIPLLCLFFIRYPLEYINCPHRWRNNSCSLYLNFQLEGIFILHSIWLGNFSRLKAQIPIFPSTSDHSPLEESTIFGNSAVCLLSQFLSIRLGVKKLFWASNHSVQMGCFRTYTYTLHIS